MKLTKNKGIILRKLLLITRRKWFNKQVPISFGDIAKYLKEDLNISRVYVIKILCDCIKENLIILHSFQSNHSGGKNKMYLINEDKIFNILENDDMFKMDEEIISKKYTIMIE